jgi:superfamily II helicase
MGLINEELYGACGDGWNEIIQGTHEKLRWLDPDYHINQIKEKFGGLRYYFTPSKDVSIIQRNIMNDVVALAEYYAWRTCEKCGAEKSYNTNVETRAIHHWYLTRCDKCYEEELERRK